MTTTEKLAGIIRRRYDESPPGKWPTEDSLAAFIIEHAERAGLDILDLPDDHKIDAYCNCNACIIV